MEINRIVRFCFTGAALLALSSTALAKTNWLHSSDYQFKKWSGGFYGPAGLVRIPEESPLKEVGEFVVTEIRGEIALITADKQRVVLAKETDLYIPPPGTIDLASEIGQIGACFNPSGNYFYTTAVTTVGETIVNKVSRWNVGVKDGKPFASLDKVLSKPFAKAPATANHQIGQCFFDNEGNLWVGTGDGYHHRTSHVKEFPNGKVMRMTEDFVAHKDNPFFDAATPGATESYVYSMGMRNPIAIAPTPWDEIVVADNGVNMDRVLSLEPGKNYPWDGDSDLSLAFGNVLVFPVAIGPAALVYVPEDHPTLVKLRGHFVVTASYQFDIYAFPYEKDLGVTGQPFMVLERTKEPDGALTGLALDERGLFVAEYLEDSKGGFLESSVYLLSAAEGDGKAAVPMASDGRRLFRDSGCYACHVLNGQGSSVGPILDGVSKRVEALLSSDEYYEQTIMATDAQLPAEHEAQFEILKDKTAPLKGRLRAWVGLKIVAPRLLNPNAGMPPRLEGDIDKALQIADYLLDGQETVTAGEKEKVKEISTAMRLRWYLKQNPNLRTTIIGILCMLIGWFAHVGILRLRRKTSAA